MTLFPFIHAGTLINTLQLTFVNISTDIVIVIIIDIYIYSVIGIDIDIVVELTYGKSYEKSHRILQQIPQ